MECFCFPTLPRLWVFLHFSLISRKLSLKWAPFQSGHLLKPTRYKCIGPVGVHFSLDSFHCRCTLKVQIQQPASCSKSTVNTRKRCEICSKLTKKTRKRRYLLLTLNIFHNFFCCFFFSLWTGNYFWEWQFESLDFYADQCLAQHDYNFDKTNIIHWSKLKKTNRRMFSQTTYME